MSGLAKLINSYTAAQGVAITVEQPGEQGTEILYIPLWALDETRRLIIDASLDRMFEFEQLMQASGNLH